MGDGRHDQDYLNRHERPKEEEEEEEEEEALSLCDLPINTCEQTNSEEFTRYNDVDDDGQQSSELPEFFEFFSDLSTEMCLAEDIIFGGKIVPFQDQQKRAAFRRRCESSPQLETTRSNSSKTRLLRYSHSLDYDKLHRSSSSEPVVECNSSEEKSHGKGHISSRTSKSSSKSRWFMLMFGSMKFPPEMELRDIKSRQVRCNPSAMFPPLEAGGKVPARQNGGKGSWRLFNVLSCKDHASIAVTGSFTRMPLV